jgi:hypothetical protein
MMRTSAVDAEGNESQLEIADPNENPELSANHRFLLRLTLPDGGTAGRRSILGDSISDSTGSKTLGLGLYRDVSPA